MSWRETTGPVLLAGELWTHVTVRPDGQIFLAQLMPSGVPEKVCRLADIIPR